MRLTDELLEHWTATLKDVEDGFRQAVEERDALRAELYALKARRCKGCKHLEDTEGEVPGPILSCREVLRAAEFEPCWDCVMPPDTFCCSAWESA